MLIIGTGGLGKEVLGILITDSYSKEIVFYDENINAPDLLYNKFKIIKSEHELKNYLTNVSPDYISAIGHPRIREKLSLKIENMGGIPANVISKTSFVFPFLEIFEGCIIQPGAGLSHGIKVGKGNAIHINSTIGHNVKLGKFVNIGPNATIIGPCEIDDYAYISAQATILPKIRIGKNAIISANCIVNKDVQDNETYSDL